MPFDFETNRSPLILCQELGQESQLGTAGPAPIGSLLPASPLQAHHLAPLPKAVFLSFVCAFPVLGLHPLSATFVV